MRYKGLIAVVAALAIVLCAGCVIVGSNQKGTSGAKPVAAPSETLRQEAAAIVAGMTLDEKIAQLFIVTPEALTGYETVTAAGRISKEAFRDSPVGGLVYDAKNLETPAQTREMLASMEQISQDRLGIPVFLCIAEEGGEVSPIADKGDFGVSATLDAAALDANGGPDAAKSAATNIAGYLADLGFTVNFAPVADLVDDTETSSLGNRSFGSDADKVAGMVSAQVEAYLAGGVLPCVKYFPGAGRAETGIGGGAVTLSHTLADLEAGELAVFRQAIEAGAPFVMVGHVGVPRVVGSSLPVSFSSIMISGVLRGDLGYEGIVITEALNDPVVRDLYSDYRIGVEVLLAGADMIYLPADFATTAKGIKEAVKAGELTETRIDESVERIVLAKLRLS